MAIEVVLTCNRNVCVAKGGAGGIDAVFRAHLIAEFFSQRVERLVITDTVIAEPSN